MSPTRKHAHTGMWTGSIEVGSSREHINEDSVRSTEPLQDTKSADASLSQPEESPQAERPSATLIDDFDEWKRAGRPHVFHARHPRLRSCSAYLQGVKSVHYRRSVRRDVKKRLGRPPRSMNQEIRICLQDSIVAVLNVIEGRTNGQSEHPCVEQLQIALNLVLDDLGWNERIPNNV